MTDPAAAAEIKDALAHLENQGFAKLLQALQDERAYTHGGTGRLNLAALARRLKVSPRRATSMLKEARAALA